MKLLTVNLEEKLISEKRKSIAFRNAEIEAGKNIIEQANSILSESTESTINTLESAGFGTAIKNANNVVATNLKRKAKLESLKNERIFTLDEIYILAMNYGLRFLPTTYYKGDIPAELSTKIKEVESIYGKPDDKTKAAKLPSWASSSIFSRNRNVGVDYPYMILAPASSFELQERPKDPLLFRSLPDGTFYLVHKWGSDLSIFRYLSFSFNRSRVPYLIIGLLIYAVVAGIFAVTPELFFAISFGAIVIITFGVSFPEIGWKIDEYKSNWNSPYKD